MDLSVLNKDELKKLAEGLEGFNFHPNIGEDTLRTKLDAFIKENPDCLGPEDSEDLDINNSEDLDINNSEGSDIIPEEDTSGDPEKIKPEDDPEILKKRIAELEEELLEKDDSPAPVEELVKDKKIKSDHRGEISSSVGVVDFGKDGVAMVTSKQAKHFLALKGYST